MEEKKSKQLADLNQLYNEAETSDKKLFSEQRSNCLLYAGDHYAKKSDDLRRLVNGAKTISKEAKIRLTENHIGLICDRLMNATAIQHGPSVFVDPRHKSELQDKKAAEIAGGVWKHIAKFNSLDEVVDEFAFDYIVQGEMFSFINYDPSKGNYLGQRPLVDELTGEQVGEEPAFDGEVTIERWESFNVLRDPSSKSWDDCSWVIYRQMVDTKVLKEQFALDDEDVKQLQHNANEETFTVFDAQKGAFTESGKDKVLLKKMFYRPSPEDPQGKFVFFTSDLVIAEGSLNGVFPVVYKPYTKIPTSPRGRSIIKRLRPMQSNINRVASQIAESQVYFKDRLLMQNGSKLSHGGQVAGTVGIKYTGAEPKVWQGQTGEKYLSVLERDINNMYKLSNLPKEEEEAVPNADPYSLLFRTASDKKRFKKQVRTFEQFLVETAEIALKLAQMFFTEEKLIPALDKKEHVNITEFKNISNIDYSLEVRPMSEDIETKLGEAVQISHALQYGQNLGKEETAALVANMPYLKDSILAQELTADNRAVEDVMAALERGEMLPIIPEDNHKYTIKRLSNRMKESSFKIMHPQIQDLYRRRIQMHQQYEAENARQIQMAQQQMIPAGGALINVSLKFADTEKNVRLPHDGLLWLAETMEKQGTLQQTLQEEVENPAGIAGIAQQVNTSHTPNGAIPASGAL